MPDRLPSLIVLAGFWVPPMVAGWMAAGSFQRRPKTERARLRYATLTAFVLGYVAIWFVYNATRMPPYIPGSTRDRHEETNLGEGASGGQGADRPSGRDASLDTPYRAPRRPPPPDL